MKVPDAGELAGVEAGVVNIVPGKEERMLD